MEVKQTIQKTIRVVTIQVRTIMQTQTMQEIADHPSANLFTAIAAA